MVEQSCIATDLELIYYVQKRSERHSYIREIYTRLYTNNKVASDLIWKHRYQGVRTVYLNVGGTVITPPPSFDDSSKLQNIGPLREGLTGEDGFDVVETQGLEQG